MQSWVRSSLRLGVLGAGFMLLAASPAYAGGNGDGDKVNIDTSETVDSSVNVAPVICDVIDVNVLIIDSIQNTDCYSDDYHKDMDSDTNLVSNDDKNITKKGGGSGSYERGEAGLLGGEGKSGSKGNGSDGDVVNVTDKDFTDNSVNVAPVICDVLDINILIIDSVQNTDCYSDDYHKDMDKDVNVVSNDDKNIKKSGGHGGYDEAARTEGGNNGGDVVNITDKDYTDNSVTVAPAICDVIDINVLIIDSIQNTDCYSDDYHKDSDHKLNVVSNDDKNIKKSGGDSSYGEARTEAKPDLSSVLPTQAAPNALPDASGLTQNVLSKAPTAGNGLMVNDRDLSDTSLVGKLAMPGAIS